MQDQVEGFRRFGVVCDYLSSSRTDAERREVMRQLRGNAGGARDALALLFATPELLASDRWAKNLLRTIV
jgi:superfamily II DNA helicase RecQ